MPKINNKYLVDSMASVVEHFYISAEALSHQSNISRSVCIWRHCHRVGGKIDLIVLLYIVLANAVQCNVSISLDLFLLNASCWLDIYLDRFNQF